MGDGPASSGEPRNADDRRADSELVESLLRPSKIAIPVVGAGVPQSAKLPGSPEIARHLIDHFGLGAKYPGDPPLLPKVVDETLFNLGLDVEVSDVVREYVRSWPEKSSTLIENLSRVQSRFVATLNYDPSIERAAERRREHVETLGNSPADLERALEILREEEPPKRLTVLHLHGRAEGNEELVLTAGSYRRAENAMKESLLRELLIEKRLFFFGTNLDEVELLALIQKFSAATRRPSHLFFCLEEQTAALTESRAAILPARSNLYVNPVESFDQLALCAGKLVEADPPAVKVAISPVDFDSLRYVPNRLLDRRGPDPDDPATIAAAIRAGEEEVLPGVPEEELLNSPRTVVLGEPGTGKTEMLRRLASIVRPPRRAVLIRLADVSLDRQLGPRETLRAWAREGSAFQDKANFEVAALDLEPFHFFLDGLDEVASDLQRDVAARIGECATELPQHSFTLASRPLPSLELLRIEGPVASDWEQLVLRPDERWRADFLATAKVALEDLYKQMPALEDLSDVTTTPFYLSRIVKLASEDRLKGLPDFSALLRTLLDAAIAHEGDTLGIDEDRARAWLREVALAGTLAGRRTFSAAELEEFDLPAGAGIDQLALARALEHRLLLAEDSGSFRFHHRLLGEQLAAEALLEHGPLPELLDALVPLIDRDLSGVRADAAVPIALAALQGPAWRSALAKRDQLAAARSTPESAGLKEVEAAARTLWNNAVETQVWMWERGMQIVDDADSLGRLMKTAGGCPLEAALLAAARGEGSDEDRGNAIRVLTRAEHHELEVVLREVLKAPEEQNSVVLRQTVIAAEHCGFLDLIDPIVDMLKREDDHLVHQVGVHVLSRLVPRERLLDVFLELTEGPEASYAVTVVLSKLDARESLRLLADYLAKGNDERDLVGRRQIEKIFENLDVVALDQRDLIAAIDVALGLRLDTDRLAEISTLEPDITLGHLVQLVKERDFDWWEVIPLAENFEPNQLLAAGAPDELAERAKQRREARAEQAKAIEEAGEPEFADLHDRTPTPDRDRMGLAALLALKGSDAELQHRYEELTAEVKELEDRERSELLERLEAWWPDKPFAETITRKSSNTWSQEWPAYAWLQYGPEASPPLSPSRWAELAASGILWAKQTTWLRNNYSAGGAYAALSILGEEQRPERWDQFLSCCPDPLPNPVLLFCAEHLNAELPEEDGSLRSHLRSIAKRMIENGRHDIARRVAANSEAFMALLEPLLAVDGDVEIQRKQVARLAERLREVGAPSEEALHWMNAVTSPQLLADLFAILEEHWELDDRPAAAVRIGYGLHDLFNPLQDAIARIGGREAIARYDRLLAAGGDYRWLRRSRDRIAAAELLSDGQRYGPWAAKSLSLPVLDPEADVNA